jgi:ribosomal protein S18 acetylase RimI-like enzyme
MNRLSFLLIIVLGTFSQATALVISFPRAISELIPADLSSNDIDRKMIPLSLRIRSTREEDIPKISALLATAGMENEESNSFAASINKMRLSASFQSLLSPRFQALQKGREVISQVSKYCLDLAGKNNDFEKISAANRLRLIWEHDSFRSYLQKASLLSNEPHIWKDHNFYLCPSDPSQLQHMMVTAEDRTSGSIVGFCEVAMLLPPHAKDVTDAVPTIVNLVISRQYRRRGVANRLLATTMLHVARFWNQSSSDEIALYVASDNESAISLYKKNGFQPRHPWTSSSDHSYFTKTVHYLTRHNE